jgi:hypothetical protein
MVINAGNLLIPIIAPLPFVMFYMETAKTGFSYTMLARSNKLRYYGSQILAAAISGMLVIMCSILLFSLFFLLQGYGIGKGTVDWRSTPMYKYTGRGMYWVPYVVRLISEMFFGGIWSVTALALSSVTTNKYLVISMPFFIFEIIENMAYISRVYVLAPLAIVQEYTFTYDMTLGGMFYSIGYSILLMAICAWIYCRYRKGQLING